MYVIQDNTTETIDQLVNRLRNRIELERLGEIKRKEFVRKTVARQIRRSRVKMKEVEPVEMNDSLNALKYVVRPYSRNNE